MGFVKKHDKPCFQDRRSIKRDYEGLKKQLNDPDPSVRRWAAKDIVSYSGASLVLVERLKKEPCRDVREAIFTSLIHIKDEVAMEGLIDCLRSEDASLRNESIEAIKLLSEEAEPLLKNLLHDVDADVRIFAVNILESLKHPDLEDWLIEVINRDRDINVCASAADLLAEIGTEKSIKPLRELLVRFSDEPYIRFVVETAIKRISYE